MIDKWLVLVSDENGQWSVVVQTSAEKPAREFEATMTEQEDVSPRIVLYTGDFVQV